MRSEFGKTIAVYTPLKWEATKDIHYGKDDSGSTFLLQLDLKEKMILIEGHEKFATQNRKDWGPSFSYGAELFINDRCDEERSNFALFPTSYNCGKYDRDSQQSFTEFCGATKGNGFRVTDYEVFEVLK